MGQQKLQGARREDPPASLCSPPEEERSENQDLRLSLRIVPAGGLANLGDAIEKTIDYDVVTREVRALCAKGERRLIETLAEEIASLVLEGHGAAEVEIEVEKFILPDCDSVAVKILRKRG